MGSGGSDYRMILGVYINFPVLNEIWDSKGIHLLQKMECNLQESGKARIVFDNQRRRLALTNAF